MIRTFDFIRDVDHSGISGIGKVAEGCRFSDGSAVMRWLTPYRSTVVFDSIDDLIAIHGHHGDSRLEWAELERDRP